MEQNDCSQCVALLPVCRMNSGWMLSIPGALFGFRCLIADTISSFVKWLALSALRGSFTLPVVFLVKDLSAFRNLPLLRNWAAMAYAVIGKVLVWLPVRSAC